MVHPEPEVRDLPFTASELLESHSGPRYHNLADQAEPGIEVVPAGGSDKEAVQPEKEAVLSHVVDTQQEKELADAGYEHPGTHYQENKQPQDCRKVMGLRLGAFWGVLIAAVVVLALAVGLGVGLSVTYTCGLHLRLITTHAHGVHI